MATCVVCGRETSVSDACPHCADPVCTDHRDPGNHDCPGIDGDETGGWFTDSDAGRSTAVGEPDLADLRRLGVALAVVVLLALALTAALSHPSPGGIDERAVESAVASEANDERIARGLQPLEYDPDLADVARSHSRDMLKRGYFDHAAPNGSGLGDRYARAGVDCAGGENIYATPNGALSITDDALARKVVREFVRSPDHRRALSDPGYARQGVGVVVGPEGDVYVTQNFC